MNIKKFSEFAELNEFRSVSDSEMNDYPSDLVKKYGKETIDECINLIKEFMSENGSVTFYEVENNYYPKNKLTISQMEDVVYACDNLVSNAGYYFAEDDDLNKINDKGLVPYDLVDYLKTLNLFNKE